MLRCWAGLRPAIADGRPVIGRIPGARGNQWVATGHEGLGLTTATGTASVWLDLLLGREPAIDPAPYAPDRFVAAAA
jgi:glycine/D-amino acid oxidase-like deaminating enzyme